MSQNQLGSMPEESQPKMGTAFRFAFARPRLEWAKPLEGPLTARPMPRTGNRRTLTKEWAGDCPTSNGDRLPALSNQKPPLAIPKWQIPIPSAAFPLGRLSGDLSRTAATSGPQLQPNRNGIAVE